jgi:hypothetical protein
LLAHDVFVVYLRRGNAYDQGQQRRQDHPDGFAAGWKRKRGCDQGVTETGNKGFATTKIAFIATRGGKKEVYVADYDGTNVHQLTHDGVISAHPYFRSTGRKGKLRVVLLRARLSSLPTKLAIILAHEPHPLTPVLAFWAEVRI